MSNVSSPAVDEHTGLLSVDPGTKWTASKLSAQYFAQDDSQGMRDMNHVWLPQQTKRGF